MKAKVKSENQKVILKTQKEKETFLVTGFCNSIQL